MVLVTGINVQILGVKGLKSVRRGGYSERERQAWPSRDIVIKGCEVGLLGA